MRLVYIAGKFRGSNAWEIACNVHEAEAAAIRVGDRIEGANRQTIAGVKELRDVAKRGGALVLTIRRGNQLMLVPLRAP